MIPSHIRARMKFNLATTSFMWLFWSCVHANEGLESDFIGWADAYKMHPATLVAIDPRGKTMIQAGSVDPVDLPMPIASISKTIAGQCAMYMARQEMLSMSSPVSDFLGWTEPQGAVTVTQLLTHSSGFGPDSTRRDIFGRNLKNNARIEQILDDVSARSLLPSATGSHCYNNENFLVLEAVLTAVANEDAVSWCTRFVPGLSTLESLGRADQTHALGFAGGLELSASDLALFFHELVVDEDWPRVSSYGPYEYGPGIFIQTTREGQNIFHIGGICVFLGPNIGAFAARFANGNSVAVLYSGCADQDSRGQLNELIFNHLGKLAE